MYFIKKSRLVILFLLSLSPLHIYANKLELTFCGHKQTCSRNSTNQKARKNTCCRPCECDDICAEKETCCRDKKELMDKSSYTKQKCRTLIHIPNGYSIPSFKEHLHFFTRASCPKAFNDRTMKAKCEKDIPDSVTDIRPVSSHDGKVIYKNKYCGFCHGEIKTYNWDVIIHKASTLNCSKMLQRKHLDIYTLKTELLANCILAFNPPKNIDFWKVLCFDETTVIQQCNITGSWDLFERDISNLCLNQSDGYFAIDDKGNVYRNLNCFICNGLTSKSCVNTLRRYISVVPMFTLLNVNKLLDQDTTRPRTRRCGNGEILDTYFNKCRTLYCLWNSVSFREKCILYLHYPGSIGYKLLVKVVPTEYLEHENLTRNDLKVNYDLIQEKLNFGDCDVCSLRIYFNKDSPLKVLHEMYIEFNIISNPQCNIEKIQSIFMAAEIKLPMPVNLRVNEKRVIFNISWSYGFQISLARFKIVLEKSQPLLNCQAIEPMGGKFCPKVKLLQHEVEIAMKDHPRATELTWIPNKEDINGSAFVCTNKYILYQLSSSSLKHFSCSMIIFIIFTIINIHPIFVFRQ